MESVENPVLKMKLYRKYFKRDSVRQLRQFNRFLDEQVDSISGMIRERQHAIDQKRNRVKDDVSSKIYQTVYRPWASKQARLRTAWLDGQGIVITRTCRDFLRSYWTTLFLEASQNDSLLAALSGSMPFIELPKTLRQRLDIFRILEPQKFKAIAVQFSAKSPYEDKMLKTYAYADQYIDDARKYTAFGLNSDSLKMHLESEAERIGEQLLQSRVEGISELRTADAQMRTTLAKPAQYRAMADQLSDSTYLKEKAKKWAEDRAMQYLEENSKLLEPVRKKMDLLMKKYSVVPNSLDLKTAIKRSSLSDRTMKQRLYVGGNFQILTIDPVTVDVSPLIGYRINTKSIGGAGGNFRQSFGDSIPGINQNVLGYKLFASYDIFQNFLAYGEFDRNVVRSPETREGSKYLWKNAAFLGLGRKLKIHPRVEMTAVFLYNLTYEYGDPVYPRRWNFRIGFQSSDLAFFKRK